jgi:hypothetical protein
MLSGGSHNELPQKPKPQSLGQVEDDSPNSLWQIASPQ